MAEADLIKDLPEELQEFLGDEAGPSPAEEAQGTPLAAVSTAYCC